MSRSLPAVRSWLGVEAHPIIVLCGTTGRGKSVAAAWALLQRGSGTYLAARKLEQLRMASFGPEAERYETLLHAYGLVVVDDLGREDSPERMTSALLDLADSRRGSNKRTILIANMTRKALEERYPDARLWSRLTESALFVPDAGDDLRKPVKP